MNTGGPASEKTLLDEFAGQALAAMVEAESKESHKQLTNDGYGSEETYFTSGFADEDYWDGAAKASYACASAMLAEKARREAVVQESSTTDNAAKVAELQAANRELVEALEACNAAFLKFAPQEESAYGAAWVKVRATISKHKGAK